MEKRYTNILEKMNKFLVNLYEKKGLDFMYLECFEAEPDIVHMTFVRPDKRLLTTSWVITDDEFQIPKNIQIDWCTLNEIVAKNYGINKVTLCW